MVDEGLDRPCSEIVVGIRRRHDQLVLRSRERLVGRLQIHRVVP